MKRSWLKPALISLFLVVALLAFWFFWPSPETASDSTQNLEYEGSPLIPESPRNAIIPLINPEFVEANSDMPWLNEDDIVIGVLAGESARAYPLKILRWHGIVNDIIDSTTGVLVTYHPLYNSTAVYNRVLENKELRFGNSGLLIDNDMVLYDEGTESYWRQIDGKSIKGEYFEKQLAPLQSATTTWAEWKKDYPKTTVMSIETGFTRDYLSNPYENTNPGENAEEIVQRTDSRLPANEMIVGLSFNGESKAYSLKTNAGKTLSDDFAGVKVKIVVDEDSKGATSYLVADGKEILLPQTTSYWFGWYNAHPDTEIFTQQ